MLGGRVTEFLDKYGVEYPFSDLDSLLAPVDCMIANLEAPIFDVDTTLLSPPLRKEFIFHLSKEHAVALLQTRTQILHLANNHIMDWGEAGLNSTISWCRQNGVLYAGAGHNLNEALRPVLTEIKGVSIGFLAFNMTYPLEFWATDSTAGTAYPYKKFFKENLRDLREKADFIICSFHWGSEKTEMPREYQIRYAHLAVDNGADIVVGHHPHIVQPIEIYKGKPIFYSLGNFIFGSYSEAATRGIAVEIGLKRNPSDMGNVSVKYSVWLLDTDNRTRFFKTARIGLFSIDNYITFDSTLSEDRIFLSGTDGEKLNMFGREGDGGF